MTNIQFNNHQGFDLTKQEKDSNGHSVQDGGCNGGGFESEGRMEMQQNVGQVGNEVRVERSEGIEEQPRWKQSICSRASSISNKSSAMAIHHKYSILTKKNPKILSCLKKITAQIKTQILNQKPSTKSLAYQPIQHISIPQNTPMQSVIRNEVLEDRQIVKNSCFRGLLKETRIDNDVESDDEDLNMGIRYMYGELLYSVGTEMVNHREKEIHNKKTKNIAKKTKKYQHNKENISTNLIQTHNLHKGSSNSGMGMNYRGNIGVRL